jgi:hypothetical protein
VREEGEETRMHNSPAILRPFTPYTSNFASTTPPCSLPFIGHVAIQCHVVLTLARVYCSIARLSASPYCTGSDSVFGLSTGLTAAGESGVKEGCFDTSSPR